MFSSERSVLCVTFGCMSCLCRLCVHACSVAQSLRPHGLPPARPLCPWGFPGKHTGVGCHFLLQGVFLTQEWDLRLLHWQVDSLSAEPPGKPQMQVVSVRLIMGSSWNYGHEPGCHDTFSVVTLRSHLSCLHFSHSSTSWSMMGCSVLHILIWSHMTGAQVSFREDPVYLSTVTSDCSNPMRIPKSFEFPCLLMF